MSVRLVPCIRPQSLPKYVAPTLFAPVIIRTSKVTPSIVSISREDDIIIYSGGRIETGAAQDIVKPENQNKDNLETSESVKMIGIKRELKRII